MKTLDKRNETYGLDLKIGQDMTNRAEVLNEKNESTGVSVQELVNALCDLTDGDNVYDIVGKTGCSEDFATRIMEIRSKVSSIWTYQDGSKVLG